ncbi:hypothetical protein [Lentzea albidocapillata]|nr:hypothetical protein [Lentzea albidocapillata]
MPAGMFSPVSSLLAPSMTPLPVKLMFSTFSLHSRALRKWLCPKSWYLR